jgi:hypothetical protein
MTFRSRLRCVVTGGNRKQVGESQSALTDKAQGVEGEHRNRENQFVDLHRARWQPLDIHISLQLAVELLRLVYNRLWGMRSLIQSIPLPYEQHPGALLQKSKPIQSAHTARHDFKA